MSAAANLICSITQFVLYVYQSTLGKSLGCNRQRIAQLLKQEIISWPKANHTPLKNENQCAREIEYLIVHLCKEDFDASLNATAKHLTSITGKGVSPNLVKGVRKRNGLVKEPGKKKNSGKIKSSYGHTVSVDIVREQGEHIFGFIQDKIKVVYHYLASEHNSEQAVQALKNYINFMDNLMQFDQIMVLSSRVSSWLS